LLLALIVIYSASLEGAERSVDEQTELVAAIAAADAAHVKRMAQIEADRMVAYPPVRRRRHNSQPQLNSDQRTAPDAL
jgi:hypothetical protein